MAGRTICYNIHNILSFQINRPGKKDLVEDINLPYSYFKVEHVENPDIILNIGDFTPENEGCYVVDHKWYIKKDYIYCSEHIGKIKFDIEIMGLETNSTIINVKTNLRNLKQVLFPDALPQYITLRSILDFKLLCRGFLSIHAAAVAKEKGAIVFLGRGSSFKTTLSMDYVRNLNYKFLGDDKIILKKDSVFSCPVLYKLFDYRINKMKTESCSLFDKYKYLFYQRSNNPIPEYIIDKANISRILLISRSNSKKMNVEKIHKSKVLMKTINSHKIENICGLGLMGISKGLYDYFTAYSYVFPESAIANYWDTYRLMLSDYLDADTYYEISLPRVYMDTTFNDFVRLISSFGR